MSLHAIPALHRATHAVGLLIASVPGAGVSQGEAHVLAHLAECGPSRIAEIHAAFGHRRSTLTSMLDRLEEAKLVTRSVDPRDRRSVVVTLTAPGKRRATKVMNALRAAEKAALEGVSTADVAAFVAVCDALGALAALDGK